MQDSILRVEDLQAEFDTADGVVKAVDHVTFDVPRGRTLAITGESGSGKSSVALAIMGLLPHPGRVTGGSIHFSDRDLLSLSDKELRTIRGREVAIVFQDPSTSLNPVLSIGDQVEEIIRNHEPVSRREARTMSINALGRLGLPDPERIASLHPFQLSGGMAQRVMIAIATALNPSLLILDEPTSALDVTVQAAILEDMARLQKEHGTSIVLISHDLGVVAQMADSVAVMYAGRVAEYADAATLFSSPRHPYTALLLASRPRPDQERDGPLAAIEGTPPSLIGLPDECAFLPRCHKATSECRLEPAPELLPAGPAAHVAACYNPMYREDDGAAARRSA